MRSGVKRVLSVLAIYAIALHTILSGIAPMAVASTVDPFSIICSSAPHAATQTDQAPAGQVPAPASACDHCTLCGAAAAPPLTLDNVLTEQLTPRKLLHVVSLTPAIPRGGVASNPRLAQGPPSKM